jgi:hypothetical protein
MRKHATSSIAVLLSFTCGCYTTRQVSNTTSNPIAQPSPEEGFVVQAADGKNLRIDPNSQLRFLRVDGSVSPWFHASELVVSAEGVLLQNTTDGLLWSDVANIEVKNFSGGKTLGAIAISTAAVLVIVVAIAGAKGGSGGGGGRGTVKPVGGSKGGGRGGSNIRINGGTGMYINPQPGLNVSGTPIDTRSLGSVNLASPDPSLAQPMFPQEAERKAKAQMVVALDTSTAGPAASPAGAFSVGASVVARFGNTLEMGGGLRQLLPSGPQPIPTTFGFFRFGLHLNLDQRHLFAVPINFDLGTNLDNDAYLMKINTGLRFNATPGITIGVMPFSPTYLETPQGFGWSFPSSAELSFSF